LSVIDEITKRIPSPLLRRIDSTLSRIIYRSGAGQPFQQLRQQVEELQRASYAPRDNLVNSIPVALRRITRKQAELAQSILRLRESNAEIERYVASVESKLQRTDQRVAGIENMLRNTIDRLEFTLGRLEFVRRELMLEMRHGASGPTPVRLYAPTEVKVISTDKLNEARKSGIRLNLGCGHIAVDGYLNVDSRELPGVDIVSDVGSLAFEAGEVEEIFSAHLLEHFPQEHLRRVLLPYWFGLLRPGGTFRAVVPDAEAMIREYSNGTYGYEDIREVTFGAQDYDGDFHFNMFTPSSLCALLEEAGFASPTVIAAGRRNGRCYEFEVVTTKPADAAALAGRMV
jgi:hypothetical protein